MAEAMGVTSRHGRHPDDECQWNFWPTGPDLAPLELRRPNPARVYDYLLGGCANFAVDRVLGEGLLRVDPEVAVMARANRACLGRVVRFLADRGVRQFLDLGAGLCTCGSVHEVVGKAAAGARVVYVDSDPVVVAYNRLSVVDDACVQTVQADLREPDAVLDHPDVRGLLNLSEPVAVLMLAVLHFVAEDPYATVAGYRDRVAPGSFLVISHVSTQHRPAVVATLSEVANRAGIANMPRSRGQIERLFAGWDLIPPGVVTADKWRPSTGDVQATSQQRRGGLLAAVARKPA